MESEKKSVSPEFVNAVKKYLEIDNRLKEMKEETKNLNTKKKTNEEFILNYLQTIDEKEVGVVDGKLKRNVSKKQKPLNKDYINKTLIEITGDSIKAQSITDHLIKNRPVVEHIYLKRIRNRKTKDAEE